MPYIPCESPLIAPNSSIQSPTSVLKVASDHALKVCRAREGRAAGPSIRNGVLLYQQLISPVWRSAACTHIRTLQVLQSKCLRIANSAPWFTASWQVPEELGVRFFTDRIRSMRDSTQKLAGVWNPLGRQLGILYIYADKALTRVP
jgi:hypothetical protein